MFWPSFKQLFRFKFSTEVNPPPAPPSHPLYNPGISEDLVLPGVKKVFFYLHALENPFMRRKTKPSCSAVRNPSFSLCPAQTFLINKHNKDSTYCMMCMWIIALHPNRAVSLSPLALQHSCLYISNPACLHPAQTAMQARSAVHHTTRKWS